MKQYDLIVLGGGLSGVAASVSAARRGLKVLLIEKNGALGGAAVNCFVNPFMKYTTKTGDGSTITLSAGLFGEIYNALNNDDIYGYKGFGRSFHEESLKIILDRITCTAGVDVLFHSLLCGVDREDDMIRRVTVATKAGNLTFTALTFIDASGDGDLAARAGCSFTLGREGDHLCQPMTLCFRVGNVDVARFKADKTRLNFIWKEAQEAGKIKNPREDILFFVYPVKNLLHFNSTRVIKLNPTDPFDLSRAEAEAREQAAELFGFLKANAAGFEDADMLSSAPEIGVRESRMIEGLHTLTEEELKSCVHFHDSIAAGNYDIDIHSPDGGGTSHYYFAPGEYYTIPYRCLLPRGKKNLLVAGRCISATHEAQASIRIMPICTCLGEAAGIAAAVAKDNRVCACDADVGLIQTMLRENGAFIGV